MKKLLKSDFIYKGRVVNLYLEEVEYNGMKLTREVVRHNGGAGILAEKDGKFVFVSQYRHPFGDLFLEIPAGTRDGNEAGEITAYRELIEECGLKAKILHFICDYAVSPGSTNEVLNLFYANDFELVEQHFDDDEDLSLVWIDKQKCIDMALNGEFKDGKTMLALLWYIAKYGKN